MVSVGNHVGNARVATEMPTILLVGDYMWPWYQEACALSLEKFGCKVIRFGWLDDFFYWVDQSTEPLYRSFLHRLQFRAKRGPLVTRIGRRLLKLSKSEKPDVVWFYNVQLISPSLVQDLRQELPEAKFVQYANDNPFSSSARFLQWQYYLKSICFFDIHFAYRLSNIEDYRSRGSSRSHLLRAYFIPEEDYPVPVDQIPARFLCDVVFAGHYEDDGRVEMLEAICAAGYKLNLFGGGWSGALQFLSPDSPLRKLYPIAPVVNAEYRYAICGAKVALCFLSHLNCDTYTRRNFQIPAMKTAMLSQYTEDLANLFEENVEALFFRNKEEMLSKLGSLLNLDELRESVAEAGFRKVYTAGHDVRSRMGYFLEIILSSH